MKVIFFKYIFIVIFLVSAVSKLMSFDETRIYFVAITKISYPAITSLLWILVFAELLFSVLVWMNGLQLRSIYVLVQFLLGTFLFTNILFFFMGVENCACFGTAIQSHPAIGTIKTIFLMTIVYYLREGRLLPRGFKIQKTNR